MALIEHVEDVVLEKIPPEDAHQAEEYENRDYFDLAHQCLCLDGVFITRVRSGFCFCAISLYMITILGCMSRLDGFFS